MGGDFAWYRLRDPNLANLLDYPCIEPDYRILEVCQCLCEGARGTLHLC